MNDRKKNEAKRRGPKDIKFGRTFNRLSRYDLLMLANICGVNAMDEYEKSDYEFNKWIILGE